MKLYRNLRLVVFNTLVVLVLINLFSWIFLKATEPKNNIGVLFDVIQFESYENEEEPLNMDSLEVVGMIHEYVSFLEDGKQEFTYHPATEYQLAVLNLNGIHTKMYQEGFVRRIGASEIELQEKVVYCFGGSTTFGALVKDEQSWPAFLEQKLEGVSIVNFGTPGFVPTQETNQFIHLLKSGYRPSLAIFMDGVNVGPSYDGTDFSRKISQRFSLNPNAKKSLQDCIIDMPVMMLINGEKLETGVDFFKTDGYDIAEINQSSEFNNVIAQRFIQNAWIRKSVAELYGVEIIQFLQPNGYINNPESFHSDFYKKFISSPDGLMMQSNMKAIYDEISASECGFINMSYLLENYGQHGLIDLTHYSPGFNNHLAEELADIYIQSDSLPFYKEEKQHATGLVFEN